MPPDPYSRLYWRLADEFPEVYADDHAYALYCRLLPLADAAWPTSAALPAGIRQSALKMLIDHELVFLHAGHRYRIRGLDKHRDRRQAAARIGAKERWRRQTPDSDRNAPGDATEADSAMRSHSDLDANRNAAAMHIPSRAEPSRAEPRKARALDAIASSGEDDWYALQRLAEDLTGRRIPDGGKLADRARRQLAAHRIAAVSQAWQMAAEASQTQPPELGQVILGAANVLDPVPRIDPEAHRRAEHDEALRRMKGQPGAG